MMEYCLRHSDCNTGFCDQGSCKHPAINTPCAEGMCPQGTVCSPEVSRCKVPNWFNTFYTNGSTDCKGNNNNCHIDKYCHGECKLRSEIGGPCTSNEHCQSGAICLEKSCHQQCMVTDDCETGECIDMASGKLGYCLDKSHQKFSTFFPFDMTKLPIPASFIDTLDNPADWISSRTTFWISLSVVWLLYVIFIFLVWLRRAGRKSLLRGEKPKIIYVPSPSQPASIMTPIPPVGADVPPSYEEVLAADLSSSHQ